MVEFKRYLVTSALPYANGPLHIGHLAGAYIPADIYVRFQRLMGKDIVYICGSDENGAAITMKAAKEGKSPREIVDHYHSLFRDTFEKVGISFDAYHRTSDPLHHETSQMVFNSLYEKNEFTEQESEQYFDETAGKFLADRYITGTCPRCGYTEAYGDQCESCGSSLSPTDLINPISVITGNTPVLRKTKHWYLPLDKYESWLKEWIETGELEGEKLHYPEDWKNHVMGQCRSWLEQGLQPRAMTRDLDWGVDVPAHVPGSEGKKLYVWMDAPIGYISATRQWAIDHGQNWELYWKDKETALIHFIGKDNIVFHCLIFPAILKAEGSFILPENVPANQFMNLEGKKISTSKNWAVWVHEYVEDFPDQIDELRYYLIKNMPELKDSEFTWKGYQEANNNELVNNLANFVNRVVVLTHKYYNGFVPEFDENQDFDGPDGMNEYGFHDSEMLRLFDDLHTLGEYIRTFDFRSALKSLMEISAKGNQILQFNEPWKAQKEDPEKVKAVMNLCLQYVAALSIACRPFMPGTSDKMRKLLQLVSVKEHGEWDDLMFRLSEGEHILATGHRIGAPVHLFSKIDDSVIERQIEKLEGKPIPTHNNSNPIKEEITYEDFLKMDIRTATILEAIKIPKADKLLQLTLDLGFEKRTVVSGIAEHFKPEEIIGVKVSYLANLAPRKIRGVESKGMVLMAEDDHGKLSFVSPSEHWPDGMVVK